MVASRRPVRVSRERILAFRRRAAHLDERLPRSRSSLRRAAWAGLQDSMPRAALLSIHARVERTGPAILDDPSLVQVWGPRYQAYVVPRRDLAVFTLGRVPDDARGRRVAEDLADRIRDHLGDAEAPYGEVGDALGEHPNRLRYATVTGTVLIRWDGARQPTIRSAPAPDVDPADARLELARRYLHVFGPGVAGGFATWAGISGRGATAAFAALGPELRSVRSPIGDGWMLEHDVASLRDTSPPPAAVRLLPSGDTYALLQGRERELLVPDPAGRAALWTSRVWPGALLVGGEVIGTWRRAGREVSIRPWRRLSRPARAAVEEEAVAFPLPELAGSITVRWED